MSRRILYLEPVGGIAGDMFLAAAIDTGVDPKEIEARLRTLKLDGWKFALGKATRHALTGTHLDVVIEGDGAPNLADSGHHPHGHRGLNEIRAMIEASGLAPNTKARALEIFRLIGEAEAKVHGVPVEEIHFHEVGAVDSIVDICGASVVLELLGEPDVYCAPPPLGSGTIRIAHGVVPVPVPATVELLRGVPVRYEGVGELTTPTGAALVKALTKVRPPPPMVVERTGYGVGTKDFADRANVLRFTLGTSAADESRTVEVLEANLDDCSPQVLGALVDTLLKDGALDAWVTPAVMKKNRPGHVLSVLGTQSTADALARRVLSESTTLGLRRHTAERTVLERRFDTVKTPWGDVRVKVGHDKGQVLNAAPEFDDCRALAEKNGVPLKEVIATALAVWRAQRVQ